MALESPGRVSRPALAAIAALAAIGVGVTFVLVRAGGLAKSPGARGTTDLAAAAVIDFDITTTASGQLEAKEQVELRNRLESESTIVEIVPEGTRVKKDQVLAKLNAEQTQQKIDEALLQLENAKNEAASAESAYEIQVIENSTQLRKAKVALEIAELEMQQWTQGDVQTKRQQQRLDLEAAEREVDRLSRKAEQAHKLNAQGFLSTDELQKADLELRRQEATLETAKLAQRVFEDYQYHRDRKQKQEAIDAATAELSKVDRSTARELATKDSRRQSTRQQLQLREASLAKLKVQFSFATITAPADGLVVYGTTLEQRGWGGDQGPMQIGKKVYPNQLIIGLPDTSAMNAVIKVPETTAGRVQKGQLATVRIDALGGASVSAEVLSIGLLAERENWMDPNAREFKVKLNLGPEAQQLDIRPSMRVEAVVTLGKAEKALAVPLVSVFNEGPARFVYTTDGSRYVRRPIKLGRRSDRYAEVLAGLKPGEQVLTRKPEAGEMNDQPWKPEELKVAGLKLNDKGGLQIDDTPTPPPEVAVNTGTTGGKALANTPVAVGAATETTGTAGAVVKSAGP